MGVIVVLHHGADPLHVSLIFALALLFGIAMTLPIGGADMPVVISLYNALTGLAVAFEGFVLDNAAMIIAGTVVGSAGTLLTQLMAKAMNRSLANVLFSDFGSGGGAAATAVTGSMKPIEASDVGVMMAFAQKVIVVPGYGMAVAQAQHKVWEMCQLLIERGVQVKFAIHPVAGRMPGHMNVLLAEAGVPYDLIADLDEINAEFETADVALIIGANDVVNPVARTDKSSPIYGMPILNADKAKNVIVIKRGQGAGFSGIENAPVLPRQHAHVVRRRAEGRGRARQRHQGGGLEICMGLHLNEVRPVLPGMGNIPISAATRVSRCLANDILSSTPSNTAENTKVMCRITYHMIWSFVSASSIFLPTCMKMRNRWIEEIATMLAATLSFSVPESILPSQPSVSVPLASMVDTKFS